MSRSFVQVTSGSGVKLATNNYTDGADSKHDEINVYGEQFLPTSIVNAVGDISVATVDSHLMEIMAGGTNKVRIRRIMIHQSVMATTAAMMGLAIYRLTSAGTGGSSTPPTIFDPSDSAGATARTLTTAKGTESTALWFSRHYMMQTIGASTPLPVLLDLNFDMLRTKPIIISAAATNGIAIKNTTAIAGASVTINVWIDESVY